MLLLLRGPAAGVPDKDVAAGVEGARSGVPAAAANTGVAVVLEVESHFGPDGEVVDATRGE